MDEGRVLVVLLLEVHLQLVHVEQVGHADEMGQRNPFLTSLHFVSLSLLRDFFSISEHILDLDIWILESTTVDKLKL